MKNKIGILIESDFYENEIFYYQLRFKEAGYEVQRCCLVDMFPGTVHVETVVMLSRVS